MTDTVMQPAVNLAVLIAPRTAGQTYASGQGTSSDPLRLSIVLTHADFADETSPDVLQNVARLVSRAIQDALEDGQQPWEALNTAQNVGQHTQRYHSVIAATIAESACTIAGIGLVSAIVLASAGDRVEMRPNVLNAAPTVMEAAFGQGYCADVVSQRRILLGRGEGMLFLLGSLATRDLLAARRDGGMILDELLEGETTQVAVAFKPL